MRPARGSININQMTKYGVYGVHDPWQSQIVTIIRGMHNLLAVCGQGMIHLFLFLFLFLFLVPELDRDKVRPSYELDMSGLHGGAQALWA